MKASPLKMVITGATRGIGRAMTLEFLRQGHTVYGCGNSPSNVTQLQNEVDSPENFTAIDVTQSSEVNAWAHSLPTPDLLINNAGRINKPAPFWETSETEFNQLLDTNVQGVANVLRAFLPSMLQNKTGTIINISSGAGQQGYPNIAAYCTSKFAIEGLSQALAADLPEGLACIALSPGVINTDMLQSYWGHERAGACHTPEQWATYAVPFMLSLDSSHNGQSLRIPQPE